MKTIEMRDRILVDIEISYETEAIKHGKQPIWPLIRLKINELIRSKKNINSRTFEFRKNINIDAFKSLFFGLQHLFFLSRFDFWVYSSSDRRKKLNGLFTDRVIGGIIQNDNFLCVENPYPLGKHYSSKELPKINIMSQSIFYLGELVFAKLFVHNIKIENELCLKNILGENNLDFDYRAHLKRFLGQYLFYKLLLRFFSPKAVFIVYSASSMGMIKALKEKEIPVVELQHGIINYKHLAYNVYKDFGKDLFPDFLLVYGEKERNVFLNKKNYFIDSKNVIPIGYYFLEMIRKGEKPKTNYSEFNKIVAFSFQDVFYEAIFQFINEVASLDKSICYLIIPRNINENYKENNLEPNVFIERKLNIYEALQICDIHASINSSCAVEALIFGVPNVLYDYNNWASDYYKQILGEDNSTFYVKEPEEFINVIRRNEFMPKQEIERKGSFFFKKGFINNFDWFLQTRILYNNKF